MQNAYQKETGDIRAAFSNAATTYDNVAVVQQEIAVRLCERASFLQTTPEIILDIGVGTGELPKHLQKLFPNASLIGLDLAAPMLQQLKHNVVNCAPLCADAASLPLATESVDLIISSCTLQWCNDLPATFKEIKRVLKPDGAFLFTTFGPDTLIELSHSWAQVDEHIHVNHFFDMHDVGDMMLQSGLYQPIVDMETITLSYTTVMQLMRDLKQLGAHNVNAGRRKTFTGKQRFQKMLEVYDSLKTPDGGYPATYEVIYGLARKPAVRPAQPTDGICKPVTELSAHRNV